MTNPFAAKSCTALYAQELAGTSENGPAKAKETEKTETKRKQKITKIFFIMKPSQEFFDKSKRPITSLKNKKATKTYKKHKSS